MESFDPHVESIRAGLDQVRSRIDQAARRVGRDPQSIRLVAVSKTKPVSDIRIAYGLGQRVFGENYAQELVEKSAALADLSDIELHFIGSLQSNKAKVVAQRATLVHSVDSERLAQELNKRAEQAGRVLPILLEVNLAGESTKGGISPHEVSTLADHIDKMPHLQLRGLMALPPPIGDLEDKAAWERTRLALHTLAQIREKLGGVDRLPELSMGTTDDLEVAVEEGATLVRVGTAIFGARGVNV